MIIHTVYLVIKAARIIGRKQKTEKRTSTFGCCILDVQWDEDFLTPEPLADKPLLAGRPPDRLLSSMCFSYPFYVFCKHETSNFPRYHAFVHKVKWPKRLQRQSQTLIKF